MIFNDKGYIDGNVVTPSRTSGAIAITAVAAMMAVFTAISKIVIAVVRGAYDEWDARQ